MPILIIMALAPFVSPMTIAAIFGALFLLKVFSWSMKAKLELIYSKDNELFNDFVKKSNISVLQFEPYIFAPLPFCQAFFYLIKDFIQERNPDKWDREIFKLEDGGTIGIDWHQGIPTEADAKEKPFLILMPGLGGGTQNLYCIHLMKEATT